MCNDCKKEVEGIESVCGMETDFERVLLCEYCAEMRYNKFYGIKKPKSDDDEGDFV